MFVVYQAVDSRILNSVHPHPRPYRLGKAEKFGIHHRPRDAAHQCHYAKSNLIVREYSKYLFGFYEVEKVRQMPRAPHYPHNEVKPHIFNFQTEQTSSKIPPPRRFFKEILYKFDYYKNTKARKVVRPPDLYIQPAQKLPYKQGNGNHRRVNKGCHSIPTKVFLDKRTQPCIAPTIAHKGTQQEPSKHRSNDKNTHSASTITGIAEIACRFTRKRIDPYAYPATTKGYENKNT